MKRILLSSLLLSSFVLVDKIAIPMPVRSLSVENSEQLSDQDGVGIYPVEQVGCTVIDNLEMNGLVYKHRAEAKDIELI